MSDSKDQETGLSPVFLIRRNRILQTYAPGPIAKSTDHTYSKTEK